MVGAARLPKKWAQHGTPGCRIDNGAMFVPTKKPLSREWGRPELEAQCYITQRAWNADSAQVPWSPRPSGKGGHASKDPPRHCPDPMLQFHRLRHPFILEINLDQMRPISHNPSGQRPGALVSEALKEGRGILEGSTQTLPRGMP